jgi:hypothetical protein
VGLTPSELFGHGDLLELAVLIARGGEMAMVEDTDVRRSAMVYALTVCELVKIVPALTSHG